MDKRKTFRIKLDPKALKDLATEELDKAKGGQGDTAMIPTSQADCSKDHPACDSRIKA